MVGAGAVAVAVAEAVKVAVKVAVAQVRPSIKYFRDLGQKRIIRQLIYERA